ncbi:glycosyltransferase [Phycicoccus sp. CSK15P-2]|uniref:glycosyltransferase n=1 Tax=Phycicoccus sp. CSK15P-2 TaxID=2807627 RepID=UPI001951BF8A|nr:glycosyltransferase [Phycicoccus sp. CSK15P-2]MBM6404320.1 glycosyltransferase [Phycicoccus sp. CSK15P-2]
MSTRPRVAIAHDYLTQRGGAERVVLSMARAYPEARIYTTLYDPRTTYPEFRDHDVVTSVIDRLPPFRRDHRAALPVLGAAAGSLRVDADVVLVSSSGWAHGFQHTGKSLVYCYSPARWLYQTETYLGGPATRSWRGMGLLALRPALRRWDSRAAHRCDRYLAVSRIVRDRIAETYDIDATVVPAPHGMDPEAPRAEVPELVDWADDGYLLVVSRLLPYKNVGNVVEAVRGTSHRLVVVGAGPGRDALLARRPDNVRLVSGLSDDQVRWVYAHSRLLVAPSHEDYGLTPLEAAAFGVPSLTLGAGGYLDTVRVGVTGLFAAGKEPRDLREGITAALEHPFEADAVRAHAAEFDERRFHERLYAEVDALLEGRE